MEQDKKMRAFVEGKACRIIGAAAQERGKISEELSAQGYGSEEILRIMDKIDARIEEIEQSREEAFG